MDANLLRAEADPALLDTALQAAAADAGEAALFADVRTESFRRMLRRPTGSRRRRKPPGLWEDGSAATRISCGSSLCSGSSWRSPGYVFLACTYRILRGTVEENCARWRKRSKAPKVKPGATPTPARKKPWYSSSKKATKPNVKTAPVPSTRPDRARRPPPPSSSEEERIRRRRARCGRRGRRRGGHRATSTRRRRRLDDEDDDDDDDRFAGRLVDHTTRRRPVDKPPSIFGSARCRPKSDDDDEDDDDRCLSRAAGRGGEARRAREPRVGLRPVVRRRQRRVRPAGAAARAAPRCRRRRRRGPRRCGRPCRRRVRRFRPTLRGLASTIQK